VALHLLKFFTIGIFAFGGGCVKSWRWGVLLVGVAGIVGGLVFALREPEVDCVRQAPESYPPKCVAQAQALAKAGDTGAMLRLARHFDTRDRAAAASWTRQAAQAGVPAAIQHILGHCGDGQSFTLAEAEALLPHTSELEQAYFHLGGSCKPADVAWAGKLAPAGLLASKDAASLCKVAVKFGQLSVSPAGAKLDAAVARQLLAECEKRAAAGSEPAQQARSVLQMLDRQIRPVRLE
jgi:hypothetical protein